MSAQLTSTIAFLTEPLLRKTQHVPHIMVLSLQNVLLSTLQAAIPAPPLTLTLTLSPTAKPPRPVYAACVAVGLEWSDWMTALGSVELELTIGPEEVVVRMGLAKMSLWQAPAAQAQLDAEEKEAEVRIARRVMLTKIQPRVFVPQKKEESGPPVPISKLAIQNHNDQLHPPSPSLSPPAPSRASPLPTRTLTLAQHLLNSPHEDKETEEMFALIGHSVISPTPTRDRFGPESSFFTGRESSEFGPNFDIYSSNYSGKPFARENRPFDKLPGELSPISSPEPSEPSSFDAYSDNDDNIFSDFSYTCAESSDSSFKSDDEEDSDEEKDGYCQLFNSPPTVRVTPPTPGDGIEKDRIVTAITTRVPRLLPNFDQILERRRERASGHFHSPGSSISSSASTSTSALQKVFIDTSKKAVTSYLYEGGKSTVLTGGVMLGGSAAAVQNNHASKKLYTNPRRPSAPRFSDPASKNIYMTPRHPTAPRFSNPASAPVPTYKATSKVDAVGSWRRNIPFAARV